MRVAVVVDGPEPFAWQHRVLELLGEAAAEVRVVDGPDHGWRLHRRIERRLFRLGPDPLARRPLEPRASTEPVDLVVWLAAAAPEAAAPQEHLHVGHGPFFEPAGAAFRRAIASGSPTVTTEVRLGDRVLASSVSGVRPFSATLSADAALWKTADLVARAVTRAHSPAAPASAAAPAPPPPHPAAFAVRSSFRWGRALGTRFLYRRPWRIAIRELGSGTPWGQGPELVRWLPGHVYADPFLFERDGRHHLFFEHIPAGSTRGAIAYAELRPGEVAEPVTVMEAEHHLSYPFVFEHGGELFLLPETSAARKLELHRAIDFPLRWELDTVLFGDLDVVDATPFEHDGRLWMFAAIAGHGASRLDELHLFHADGPRGPWTPHSLNPVVSDVRAGRPAGAVLPQLVRPAQDGSRRYGGAVSFREVLALTASTYEEREVGRIEPSDVPGARAVHAYARDSRYEAIDMRVREPRWSRRRSSATM